MFVTYEQIDNNTRYSVTADSNFKNKLYNYSCLQTNESCHLASMTPDVYVIHRVDTSPMQPAGRTLWPMSLWSTLSYYLKNAVGARSLRPFPLALLFWAVGLINN